MTDEEVVMDLKAEIERLKDKYERGAVRDTLGVVSADGKSFMDKVIQRAREATKE